VHSGPIILQPERSRLKFPGHATAFRLTLTPAQFQTLYADVKCFQAECAAKISVKQLRIALEMGSTPVVIRCHLYFALSLLQTSRLHAAKHLILLVFCFTFV